MKNLKKKKKLRNDVELYNRSKKMLDGLMNDLKYRKRIIDALFEKGMLAKKQPIMIYEDNVVYLYTDENYSAEFAYFVWKELVLNTWFKKDFDFDYDYYKAIECLINLKK